MWLVGNVYRPHRCAQFQPVWQYGTAVFALWSQDQNQEHRYWRSDCRNGTGLVLAPYLKELERSYSHVSVADACPGCNYGDLDLSPAAFSDLAPESQGVVSIE